MYGLPPVQLVVRMCVVFSRAIQIVVVSWGKGVGSSSSSLKKYQAQQGWVWGWRMREEVGGQKKLPEKILRRHADAASFSSSSSGSSSVELTTYTYSSTKGGPVHHQYRDIYPTPRKKSAPRRPRTLTTADWRSITISQLTGRWIIAVFNKEKSGMIGRTEYPTRTHPYFAYHTPVGIGH